MRILFITLSNIGDAVMTTPVLDTLHRRYPAAQIDIVADPRSAELFQHFPALGEIILKRKKSGLRGLLALIRQLRRHRYDLIVDLRTDGLGYLLRYRRHCNKFGIQPPGPHAVERHYAVLRELAEATPPPPRLWLSTAERTTATTALAGLPGTRWLALGPGANWPPKIWPAEHFVALVAQLQDDFDAVLLLGGSGDRERAAAILPQLALPARDFCGHSTLLQATALLEQAAVFVGNDSGLGHLASAVGTPTVTVFGPGEPLRYRPWQPQGHWRRAASGVLAELSVDDVVTAVRAVANTAAAGAILHEKRQSV